MESAFSSTREAMRRRLKAAQTESEVVGLVRDYLAEWMPDELARVPAGSRPGKIRDAEDVADCAFALTRARMDNAESDPLAVEMESFFAQACTRLSELEGQSTRARGRPESESETA